MLLALFVQVVQVRPVVRSRSLIPMVNTLMLTVQKWQNLSLMSLVSTLMLMVTMPPIVRWPHPSLMLIQLYLMAMAMEVSIHHSTTVVDPLLLMPPIMRWPHPSLMLTQLHLMAMSL